MVLYHTIIIHRMVLYHTIIICILIATPLPCAHSLLLNHLKRKYINATKHVMKSIHFIIAANTKYKSKLHF